MNFDQYHDTAQAHAELLDAARYTRDILNQIPAFGDSIGKKINKAQLATAWNKLSKAISKAEGTK